MRIILAAAASMLAACATQSPIVSVPEEQYDATMQKAASEGFHIVSIAGVPQFCSDKLPQYFVVLPNCLTENEWKVWKRAQFWSSGPTAVPVPDLIVRSGR